MQLKIYLEEQEEGGYTVFVPALPGCISQGDSIEEAVKNIKEAIELYLDEEPGEKKFDGKIIKITIPLHSKLKKGTLSRILKDSKVSEEEFSEFL